MNQNYKCIIKCVDFHGCFENFKRVTKVNVMIYIYYNNKITQNATVLYTINSMFKKIQYIKSIITY